MDATDHPITVLVVGHPEPAAPLVAALGAPQFRADAVEADALAARLADGAVDVIVVTEGPAPLAAVAAVSRSAPATRHLAVGEGFDAAALLDAGVGGVVSGPVDATTLARAVVGIAHGEGFLDAGVAREVLARHDATGLALTPTEDEVLRRLADGHTADEVADDYAVTPRLVRLHAGGAISRLLPA